MPLPILLLAVVGVGAVAVVAAAASSKKNSGSGAAPPEDAPLKYLDPWFDSQKGTEWDDTASPDYKLAYGTPAYGLVRIDAIMLYTNDKAKPFTAAPKDLPKYNAGAWALINGAIGLYETLSKDSKYYLDAKADEAKTAKNTVGAIAGLLFGKGAQEWIVKTYDKMVTTTISALGGSEAGHPKETMAFLGDSAQCFTEMASKGLLPPFTAFNWGRFDLEYWQQTEVQRAIFCNYRDKWDKIPAADKKSMTEWFTIFTKVVSNLDIQKIFTFTPWNNEGYGADSQVFLIAAPVAKFYGFDLRDFAIDLWHRCKGWASRPDLLDKATTPPDNIGVVNLTILAQDALALADEWNKDGRKSKPPASPAHVKITFPKFPVIRSPF